jgi:asparagine synthase (glutamine-hydrolysing)
LPDIGYDVTTKKYKLAMCGIFGSFSQYGATTRQAAETALHALRYRGPNDQGVESFTVGQGQLTLGHARLSIIDLSPGGHQPMQSADGRYVIVFNGEIYNYRELREEIRRHGRVFQTESDTEVLLACWEHWGTDCLSRLTGMFAFAVFDRRAETVTLIRDAFGIKPLYYYRDGESIAFASEIPALLPILNTKPKLNLRRAYRYLAFGGYDDSDDTFYENILHLQPGHSLSVKLGSSGNGRPERWWLPSILERTDLSFKAAAEELRERFLTNIRLHLRSDVPLGSALSGGIDSSAVVCGIRHIEPDIPIHTFSFVARDSHVNEEKWIDIVNEQVGAVPHKVVVDLHELGGDLDDMIRAQGEPFGDTSIYAQYRVFKLARETGITVTLDGQGADELMAGYSGYPHRYVTSLLEKRQYHKIPSFLNNWAQWPGRNRKQALQMLSSLLVSDETKKFLRRIAGSERQPPGWIDSKWFEKHGIDIENPEVSEFNPDANGRRLVEELRNALTNKGLVSLMRHGDRNSMRWSIESRVPFLTIDFAEFLLNLPEHYLLSPKGETKSIFREAMRGIVPDKILDRRDKIGFETPEQAWLKGQRKDIEKWLEGIDTLPFMNGPAARKKVADVIDGKQAFSTEAWRLINFSRWVQLQDLGLGILSLMIAFFFQSSEIQNT